MKRTSLLSAALLITACSQNAQLPPDVQGHASVRVLALPAEVKSVTLDVVGSGGDAANVTRSIDLTLANGTATATVDGLPKGNYTFTARAFDGTDADKVVLYKASKTVAVTSNAGVDLRLNRVTSALTVNATGVIAKSNVVVAKVAGQEARLVVNGTTATGTVQGIPTSRALNVLVEGRELEANLALRQQGSATARLSEADGSVSVALTDVTAVAPATPTLTLDKTEVLSGGSVKLTVNAAQSGATDTLSKITVAWGDGTTTFRNVSGASATESFDKTYTGEGPQTITVTVDNTANLSNTASTSVRVIGTADVPVTVDIGAELVSVPFTISGVPAGTERVQAVITAPLGAQRVRPQALQGQYVVELVPRGGGVWGATLSLPRGFEYTLVTKATTGATTVESTSSTFATPASGDVAVSKTFEPRASADACPTPTATLRTIPAVQGSAAASSFVGQVVTIRGVVTADQQYTFDGSTRTNGIGGFYVQDASGDADSSTSDAIFVFTGNTRQNVQVGDFVQVTGSVAEFGTAPNTLTQLTGITAVAKCSSTVSIDATTITAPFNSLERYEGMLVRIPQTLTITETFQLGQFGEMSLSATGRQFNPTNFADTRANQAAVTADLLANRIKIDDANANSNPNPVPYIDRSSAQKLRRIGDTVNNLTGVLYFGNGSFKVQPTVAPTFVNTNPRTNAPESVLGNGDSAKLLKIAGANVLNYFNELNPTYNSALRGANNEIEFNRQKTKIVLGLKALDADVVTLMEMQNNGDLALNDLVSALNAAYGRTEYAAVQTGKIGTDAIKVAVIYKPGRVNLVSFAVDNNSVFSRPPIAATFQDKVTSGTFTVIANHFKSKGCGSATGLNADLSDGQGCWNQLRKEQATALLDFVTQIKTNTKDNDVLVMGDLNSYGAEDPINVLTSGGFESLNLRVPAEKRYSYVFDGFSGYLDHALSTASLSSQVTGITEWHANSDEPTVFDYQVEFRNTPGCVVDLPTTSNKCLGEDPFDGSIANRYSDHDSVLVGLNLTADQAPAPAAPTFNLNDAPSTVQSGQTYTATLNASSITLANGATISKLEADTGAGYQIVEASNGVYTITKANVTANFTLKVKVTDSNSQATEQTKAVTVNAPSTGASYVLISQVRTAGATASDEFVELYNPTSASVDLTGCSLVYRSAAGTSDVTLVSNINRSIGANKFLLFGGAGYVPNGVAADLAFTAGLSGTGGGVALKCNSLVVDSLGFGTATNAFVEGTAAPAPTTAESLLRTPIDKDTNNNSVDFVKVTPAPRNSSN
ncbi:ExeM/NucH family extracellular endonuclease [Deinococcus yavapaiensis]|uniref:LTD domain-containing protein n=1 Tax=Deinococcus yavapaiensis KR-236 TaxID=694435 RepID=A0A318S5F8_9DEIO|nr:ExeM/NucH family extracellular endonuclease [Deinococcus yavapaiensis]PYE52933.1 hypothetical protein DES52_111105 [Deinococcus yavapaiensis KR-236]